MLSKFVSSFPSLENITGALKNIQATYEGRMTNIESRMDTFEAKVEMLSFPSLENITGALKNIQATCEGRMTNIESRMDTFEEKVERLISDNDQEMRNDIIESIKGEVNKLVDNCSGELDDRKRRELNLTIFNLPEHRNRSG